MVIALLFCSLGAGNAQEHAVIDLRNWDPEEGLRALVGDWDVAWDTLTPGDRDWRRRDRFEMPGTWNNSDGRDMPAGGYGHATFRVRVLLPPGMNTGRFWIEPASTAYELWANGDRLTRMGTVGSSRDTSVPYRAVRSPYFLAPAGILDLTLFVSNYHHRVGGMWRPIWIGSAERIGAKDVLDIGYDILLLGFCLCFALYNGIIFFLGSRKSREPLYLALFFLAVTVRIPTLGSILFTRIFPGFPWHTIITLEYLMNHAIIAFFALALHEAFPRILWPHYGTVVTVLIGAFTALLLGFGPEWYSTIVNLFVLVAVLAMIWPLVRLTQVSFSGNRDARRGLLAIAVILGIVVTEWAHYSELIISRDNLPFGFILGFFSSPPAAETSGQILFNAATLLVVLIASTLLLFRVSEGLFGAATREAAATGRVSLQGCPEPGETLKSDGAETGRRTAGKQFGLTEREQQIASLAAQGLSNKEIAAILFISEGTVRTHMYRIFKKTRSSNRTELSRAILRE
ncbi:MAG: LuxR C-terminal-related transcriptional regulator [Spirochaetaceae bacterium]